MESAILNNKSLKRWSAFALKAAVMLLLLRLFGNIANEDTVAVGVTWVLVSTLSAIAAAYVVVVKKDLKRYQFQREKLFAHLNAGRALVIVIAFVLGAQR